MSKELCLILFKTNSLLELKSRSFYLKRKDSIESDNGGLLGSTPPASGRRRRNTESSESYDDMEKPLDRQRSFNCTKLKQQVEIVNFASKHGDKAVYCGRCIGIH